MRFAAFLFLALLFPVLAFAGPIEDAKAAMDRPDYHAAFEILQPLAEVGNSEAEFWVGVLYQDGQMQTARIG